MRLLNLRACPGDASVHSWERQKAADFRTFCVVWSHLYAMCVYIKKGFERIFSNLTGSLWDWNLQGATEHSHFLSVLHTSAQFGFFLQRASINFVIWDTKMRWWLEANPGGQGPRGDQQPALNLALRPPKCPWAVFPEKKTQLLT